MDLEILLSNHSWILSNVFHIEDSGGTEQNISTFRSERTAAFTRGERKLPVIDEMRPIRMIEHTGRTKRIAPFVGDQIDICEAFGFAVPAGCSPDYISRKKEPKRRGRPKKPRVIHEGK